MLPPADPATAGAPPTKDKDKDKDKGASSSAEGVEAGRVDASLAHWQRGIPHHDRVTPWYLTADGYFGKVKFVDGIKALNLELISQWRRDADVRYLYEGPPAVSSAARLERRGQRVLLVEDNPVNQKLGCELLRALGLPVDLTCCPRPARSNDWVQVEKGHKDMASIQSMRCSAALLPVASRGQHDAGSPPSTNQRGREPVTGKAFLTGEMA